jgi:DNA-binding SARP family transcriptional activator/tetratricopeptide (TPR) repeat protein
MLQLRLFGEPVLLDASGRVTRPWRRHVALLSYLALAPNRVAARSVVADLLWPDVPEAAARASLRQALFRLRRDADELVATSADCLVLDCSRVAVDVLGFLELLDQSRPGDALVLYRAAFLESFELGSHGFDVWAAGQRARLSTLAAETCSRLVANEARSGHLSVALRWAERWTSIDPLSEPAWAHRIDLRIRTGDRTGATHDLHEARRRLVEELGIDPGPGLRELGDRIAAEGAVVVRERLHPSTEESPAMGFVGRSAELLRLRSRWTTAVEGRIQALAVTGEAGIGKSRLADEFATRIRSDGGIVLRARAYEVERGVPYVTLAALVREALTAPGLSAVDERSLAELARIVPEVVERFHQGIAEPSADLDAGRLRLHRSFRVLLENLAFEAPVLLLIDDLPWADSATLAAVHSVWREIRDSPILFLFTARSGEPEDGGSRILMNALRQESAASVETLKLGPLGLEELTRLAAEVGGARGPAEARDLGQRLADETGGNALFAVESLRAWSEGSSPDASPTVRALIADRMERLSPAGRELMRAAAVLGRNFPFPLAAAVSALDARAGLDALEELVSRGLLHRTGYEYDFVHDILRQVVHGEMEPERIRLHHRRAFERLEPRGGEPVSLERASRLANHAVGARMLDQGRRWLIEAASLARARFAGEEAERYLAEAIDIADSPAERGESLEILGDVRFSRSRFSAAALAYRDAVDLADPGSAARLRRRIRLLDSLLRSGVGRLSELDEAVASLIADAAAAGPSFLRDALTVVANQHLREGDAESARKTAASAVESAIRAGEPPALVRSLLLHAQASTLGSANEEMIPVLEEAVRVAIEYGLAVERQDAETDLATELCRTGRWPEAIRLWSRVISGGTASGAHGSVSVAHLNTADVLIRTGSYEDAGFHLAEAERISRAYGFPHILVEAQVNRALLMWYRGDVQELRVTATRALHEAESRGIRSARTVVRALVILALLEQGELQAARQHAEQLQETQPGVHPTWSDDREVVSIALSRIARASGDHRSALSTLQQALRTAGDDHARALLLAELSELRHHEDAMEAHRLARESAAIAARLGAEPLLTRVSRLATSSAVPADSIARTRPAHRD